MKKLTMASGTKNGPHFAIDRRFAPQDHFAGLSSDGQVEAVYPVTVVGEAVISNVVVGDFPTITPVVDVPGEVPKWAAEIALIDAGLDALPQTYLDSLPAGAEKKKAVALHRSRPMWRRNSAMLQAAITAGLVTSTQVDDLFIAADVIAKTA